MIIFIILLLFFTCNISSTKDQTSAQKTIASTQAFDYEANFVFHAIDFPLSAIQDPFTKKLFNTIDTVFGPHYLNLSSEQIALVKKAYLYLIFLAKLEKVQLRNFAQYKPDFQRFLQDNNTAMPHIPDEKLITSVGWNSVTISSQDLQLSSAWQLFCKSMVSGAYSYFFTALDIIHNVEQQTFNFIPHIETAFYNEDYTKFRTINEITRIKIILEQISKKHFLTQCPNWKDLPSFTNPKLPKGSATLEQEIISFRQSSFYKNSHNIYELLGIKEGDSTPIAQQALLSPKQLQSPLKEQVWCFLMLKEITMMFYGLINQQNAENVLFAASQSGIEPNFFPYTINDYAYFDELIALKSKAEETHTQSVHPSPPTHKAEETHFPVALARQKALQQLPEPTKKQPEEVKFQNIFDDIGHFFSHVGHDIAKAATDVWHGIKKAADAAWDGIKAAGEGIAGLGASVLGNMLDIKYLKEHGSALEKDAVHNIQHATTDLESSLSDFTKGLEDGIVAPLAEVTGDMAAIITDDKKLGQSLQTVVNQVADTLANVGDKLVDATILQPLGDSIATAVNVGSKMADVVADATLMVYGGPIGMVAGGMEMFHSAGALLDATVKGITHYFTGLVGASKQLLGSVVQALGVIVNSMTTLFIDVCRDISFVATVYLTGGIGLVAWEVAYHSSSGMRESLHKYRDHTSNVLNAHRQTINQVMGVALAIGVTVATAGAGSEAGAGLVAAEAAGEAGAETAVTTTATTAATTGAETTATTAATTTGETAGEQAGEQAGEEIGEQGGKQVAKQAGKDAAEQGEKDAAEQGEKQAAKQAERQAAKQTTKQIVKRVALKGLHFLGIAMTVVFGAFNILAGVNGDAKNLLKEKQEAKQLKELWAFINSSKLSTAQTEYNYFDELQAKQQAEIGNRTMGLSFLQNILYSSVDKLTQTLSETLAQKYITLLTPNSSDMLPANIGTSWGIDSPYLDLYPSQGFSTTTTGRLDFPFAQEIAQAPLAAQKNQATSTSNTMLTKPKEPAKLWFNQKVIALDTAENKKPTDPLSVDIDMQVIYTLNSEFHTGLYLGGSFQDYTSKQYLQTVQANNSVDLNDAHLAKMVVLYRNSAQEPLHLGVYEQEGLGWILQEKLPDSMQLNEEHTYHIKTTLDKTHLSIMLWTDDNTKNSVVKNVTVSEIDNQRTYGVIASGVAIQWNQTNPKVQLTTNPQARPPIHKESEIDREKRTKQLVSKVNNITFGSIALQSLSKQATLFGQYIYSTQSTDLKKINPKATIDYMVFATNDNGTISNIGAPPISVDPNLPNPNAIVSVISGHVYNEKGNIVAHASNVWEHYQQQHGPFNPNLVNYIATLQKAFTAQLSNMKFGSFDLDIMSSQALSRGQYVYKCNQTIINEQTKKPVTDYLILAELNKNKLGNHIGMPPTSNNAQGVVSLVTGKLYAKNTAITPGQEPVPIAQGYSELYAYESKFGTISASGLQAIKLAQSSYRDTAAKVVHTPKVITFGSSSTSSSSISTQKHNLSTGSSIMLLGSASKGNISQLQQHAAGGVGLQLVPPKPPSLKLGQTTSTPQSTLAKKRALAKSMQ